MLSFKLTQFHNHIQNEIISEIRKSAINPNWDGEFQLGSQVIDDITCSVLIQDAFIIPIHYGLACQLESRLNTTVENKIEFV